MSVLNTSFTIFVSALILCINGPSLLADSIDFHFPDLSKIIEQLPEKSPRLIEQQLITEEEQAKSEAVSSRKGLKVGVSVNGYSIHEDRPKQDFEHRYKAFAGLTFRKPLYHWGILEADERISQLFVKNTIKQFDILKRSMVADTRSRFLNLVKLAFKSRLAKDRVEVAGKLSESALEKRKLGLIDGIAVQGAQRQKLDAEMGYSEVLIDLNYSLADFREFTGYRGSVDFSPSDAFLQFCLTNEFDAEEPILITALSSLEDEELSNLIKVEEMKIHSANHARFPKFDLMGSYYQDQVDLANTAATLDRNNLIVGLEANWEIWDSSKSRKDRESADARKRRLEFMRERMAREKRIELKYLSEKLGLLRQKIDLSKSLITFAKSKLEKSVLEFEQNRISSVENFQAHLDLDQARLENLTSVCLFFDTLDQYNMTLTPNPSEQK